MATPEHLELSSYIKDVHLKLRNNAKKIGYDLAWKQHCADDNCLEQYADKMKTLALTHWDKNAKLNSKVISRINWVHSFCLDYFSDGLNAQRIKEKDILHLLRNDLTYETIGNFDRLLMLDVGSCYNPFKIYDLFQIIPVDIAPACDEVYKCDFINVDIGDENIFEQNTVIQLKQNTFHVVVFCLLLEYLPSPEQRLMCCKNAYKLLKYEGILVIITPDSKHVGANAKLMKSWRYTLALMGFSRIKYEKLPYLHCMVFRKSIRCEVPQRWASLHKSEQLLETLVIPQDFNSDINEDKTCTSTSVNVTENYLSELPFNIL